MKIKPMTRGDAQVIQSWTYPPPYDFYNQSSSEEGIEELMAYHAIYRDEELIGFYCLGSFAQVPNSTYSYSADYTDVGFGMRPDLTGQGNGRVFVEYVMSMAEKGKRPLRLTVASFNQRAIRLYEQVGFRTLTAFDRNGTVFQVMTR